MRCRVCKITVMEQHRELLWWKKCPTCGYCALATDLSEANKLKAELDPLMKDPAYSGVGLPAYNRTVKQRGNPTS